MSSTPTSVSSEKMIREEKDMLLVNHAFAWVSPAIFVIFGVLGTGEVPGANPLFLFSAQSPYFFEREKLGP